MGVTTNAGCPTVLDDKALINLVLTGQAEYFGLLMDRHLAAVRGRVQWMTRSAQDADDIMQETQLKAWKGLDSFRSEASFRTWMTRIAINELLQFYRKADREPLVHDLSELAVAASPSDSPFEACLREELAQNVKAAVSRLPSKYKQVVFFRNVQELSLRDTARELQTTTQAVKARLFRARAALSKALLIEPFRDLGSSRFTSRRRACSENLAA
jgi:RNA polymerase sigma-70 factor (ECF subfamily)